MHYAVLKLQSLRNHCRRILPEKFIQPRRAHDEGLYPKKVSEANMELEPESPASSWVAWEVSPRQRGGKGRHGRVKGGSAE